MSVERRRRKAHRQAEFWAAGPTRTITVTLTADTSRFRSAGWGWTPQREIEQKIRETNRAAMRVVDRHLDDFLASQRRPITPPAFTREDTTL